MERSADRQAAADEAFGAIAEVDRLMSDYRADSELSHLNQTAAREARGRQRAHARACSQRPSG